MAFQGRRVLWVDCAKAIGILLIVLWHSPTQIISEPYLLWVKACAVPLFFFLSGFFVQTDADQKIVFIKKTRAILLPYFSGSIVALLGSYMISGGVPKISDIGGVLYGSFHYLEWGPLWFLPHLFLVSLFSGFLILKFRVRKFVILLIAFFMLIINVLILDLIWVFDVSFLGFGSQDFKGWPFSLDLIFVSVFFYISGWVFYDFLKSDINPFFWFLVAVLFLTNVYFNGSAMDLALRRYDDPMFSTLYAVVGILMVIGIAKIISLSPRILKVFRVIGNSTLIILIFHEAIQRRVYGYFESQNLPFEVSGLLAFFVAILIPVVFSVFVFPRFKVLALAFNCQYRPLGRWKSLIAKD